MQQARDDGADVAEIEYGAPPGNHPVRVNIDYEADATDDEVHRPPLETK